MHFFLPRYRSTVPVIALAMLLSGCFGPDTPEEHLQAGRESAAQGNANAALVHFRSALQQAPDSVPARYELGMLNTALGDLVAAERFLKPVVDAGFERATSVPALASAYLQQNEVFALETLLDQQAYLPAEPGLSRDLSLFRVLWLLRTGDPERARGAFDALRTDGKGCERCMLTQAYLDSVSDPGAAKAILERLIEAYPDNAEAHLLLGQLSLALRNPRQAYDHFARFKSLQPRAVYVELLLALGALQMDALAGAGQHVDRMLQLAPRQPLANHLKALLMFRQERHAEARQHAEESITRGLKAPGNFLVAGVSAYHMEQWEIAYDHLRKAVVFYPANAHLNKMLLAIQLQFGYLEEAQATYLKQDVRSVQDVLFGNAMAYQLIKDGQFSAAGNVLAYLEDTPVSSPAVRLQTAAVRAQLDPEAALAVDSSSSDTVLDSFQNVSRLAPILILLQSGALEEAEAAAKAWLAESPDSVDALNTLAYVYQQSSDQGIAAALYDRAQSINPDNVPSRLFAAGAAEQGGSFAQARTLYREVLEINPRSLIALQRLLQLSFSSQQVPEFEELLGQLELTEVSDDQMIALSDALFRWQQYQVLDDLLAAYAQEREWSDLLWMVWLKNSYFYFGPERFQAHYERYAAVNQLPDHTLFALSILEQQGQWQLALNLLDGLSETIAQAIPLQLARAATLLELGGTETAQEIIDALGPEIEAQSARWYLMGRLAQQRGDLAVAASYLSAYHEASPGFNSVTRLATVLEAAGRHKDALVLAQGYLEEFPGDDSARLALAMMLAPTEPDIALDLLQTESVKWLIGRSWQLSNNLAWLYLQAGEPDLALPYADNAMAIKPDDVTVRQVHASVMASLADAE